MSYSNVLILIKNSTCVIRDNVAALFKLIPKGHLRMGKLLPPLVALIAIGSGIVITHVLYSVPEPPELDLQKWWGLGSKPREEDKAIRVFSIDFNDAMVTNLKQRLKNRRPFTKPLEGIQSEYGINTVYLEEILDYWTERYNFKRRAELLNRFPHFKTRIQGLDIHFIRVKPSKGNMKTLPLLMMHGWPSSSKEFDKVIPTLTTSRKGYDFIFEVIAPDLPGHGFSEGTNKPGLNPVQIAVIMRNLMRRLGFDQFYIQAGDWGSQAAMHMATLFPNEVLGYHNNMPISLRPISLVKMFVGSLFPRLSTAPEYTDRLYPLSNYFKFLARETGYFHIQATKPDTIGVALSDSPAGLAAYIMEKMAISANRTQLDTRHSGLDNFLIDDILDTITIVWANNASVTQMRLYYEALALTPENIVMQLIPTKVPTAVINFKYEIIYQPDWILKDKFPYLVHSTTCQVGGHFAAMQTPQPFVDDVWAAAAAFIKYHEQIKSEQTGQT